jgi:hypothetical protein
LVGNRAPVDRIAMAAISITSLRMFPLLVFVGVVVG